MPRRWSPPAANGSPSPRRPRRPRSGRARPRHAPATPALVAAPTGHRRPMERLPGPSPSCPSPGSGYGRRDGPNRRAIRPSHRARDGPVMSVTVASEVGRPTAAIAEWSSSLKADDIPELTARRAGWQWASVLGAVLAVGDHPHSRAVGSVARRQGGAGPSTLLPELDGVAPEAAVWANAARSVLLDFDDYLFAGHTGHSAVLVTLALGEEVNCSGADLLAATVAGNEAGGRLGAAMLTGPHNGQMWAYIHNIGGAVAAARLLHLDDGETAAAIGISLTQPPYPLPATFMGSDGKALTASAPSVEGLRAALLAAEGLRCDVDVLTDRSGFFARFHPDALQGM